MPSWSRCYEPSMGTSPDRQPSDAPVSLDQAFFETDDPELRAFADKQTGRKLVLLVGTLTVILASGGGLCWAIYHAVR